MAFARRQANDGSKSDCQENDRLKNDYQEDELPEDEFPEVDLRENDLPENDPPESDRPRIVHLGNSYLPNRSSLYFSADRNPRASRAPVDCGREAR